MTYYGHIFYNLIIIIVTIIFVLKPVNNTQFTHDRKRVGPIDLVMAEQSCLKKFTVNENTIIRTQDSRLLGAKFLNESDIGNREDCLTFCCNTRFCDVAVFQEKSPFSCYLFDCGPPDNFLCKFTSHSYYTSAVLAVNRHQLDLGVWSSQYQHEAELTDLRSASDSKLPNEKSSSSNQNKHSSSSEEINPIITETTASPTTLPTTSATTNTPSRSIPTKSSPSEPKILRKCSNFQFECHSGECIAIYNACDGIPQCKDGSDEGKELGCPQGVSSVVATNDSEAPKSTGGRLAVYNEDQWNGQSASRRKYGQERGIFNHRGNVLDYNHNPNDRSPDYAREESLGYGGHGKGPGGYYDYDQRQPSVPKYNLGRPEVMKGESASLYHHDYPDYSLINRQREMQPIPNLHPHQQIYPIQMNQRGSPPIYQQDDLSNKQGSLLNTDAPIQGAKISAQRSPVITNLPEHEHSTEVRGKTTVENIVEKTEETQQNALSVSTHSNKTNTTDKGSNPEDKKDTNTEEVAEGEKKTAVASKTKEADTVAAHASLSRLSVNIEELERENEDQKSQTSGAILALSLGMCITALLIVLVGCKIRKVKKRVRRRKGLRSPLEHDVDYLVNGMYL